MSGNYIEITWFHRFGNWALLKLFRLLLNLQVIGGENIVHEGPSILATNHTIFLDSPLSISLIRSDCFPMAKSEVFEGPFAWVFRNYRAFPVRRGEADLWAIRTALKVLQMGHTIYIAPEGTRTKEGTLQEGHDGVGFIAWRSGAAIQPVAIVGARQFWHCVTRLRRTPIEFKIGKPLCVRPLAGKPTRAERRQITDEIMFHIAELLPPALRGDYAEMPDGAGSYLVPYTPEPAEVGSSEKEAKRAVG